MRTTGCAALLVGALSLTACGEPNYAEDLEQPPTTGVPSVGPGSGAVIAAHLHYTMQKNNPTVEFEDPSCPDVPSAQVGASVVCTMLVDGEEVRYRLTMRKDGRWDIGQ
jgi:hypothetical protein